MLELSWLMQNLKIRRVHYVPDNCKPREKVLILLNYEKEVIANENNQN